MKDYPKSGHNIRYRSSESDRGLQSTLHGIELVYYVRRRGCIKIGYSGDMAGRLRTLGCTWADVIAVEFGGRDLERERHAQFEEFRITRPGYGVEHYRVVEPLIEHMRQTMEDTINEIRRRVA